MSSLPTALAMMSRGEARRLGARSEAGTAAAREPAAIGARVPAVPAVRGGRAALVVAGHSEMTGGLTRGLIAPNGWPAAGRIATPSVVARC
jgi:hypothetical protein